MLLSRPGKHEEQQEALGPNQPDLLISRCWRLLLEVVSTHLLYLQPREGTGGMPHTMGCPWKDAEHTQHRGPGEAHGVMAGWWGSGPSL